MATRQEGQIWIDKNAPHNLKYFVNGKEYAIDTEVRYTIENLPADKLGDYHIGTLLAIEGDILVPARFPDHYNKVVGVCTEEGSLLSTDFYKDFVVISEGFIEVTSTENQLEGLNPSTTVGTPVYWDMGYYESDTWKAPSPGKLSLKTPNSAYTYSNLPMVGVVSKVTSTTVGGSTITSAEILLNFSKFDSTIEWKTSTILTKNTTEGVSDFTIKTGLLQQKSQQGSSDDAFTKSIEVFSVNNDSKRPILCNYAAGFSSSSAEPKEEHIYLNLNEESLGIDIQGSVKINC